MVYNALIRLENRKKNMETSQAQIMESARKWNDALTSVLNIPLADSTILKSIDKIRRPPNCYMLYQMKKTSEIYQKHPTRPAIAKRFSKLWLQEPQEVKNIYKEMYRKLDKIHRDIYPNFKPKPGRKARNLVGQRQEDSQTRSNPQIDSTLDNDHSSEREVDAMDIFEELRSDDIFDNLNRYPHMLDLDNLQIYGLNDNIVDLDLTDLFLF